MKKGFVQWNVPGKRKNPNKILQLDWAPALRIKTTSPYLTLNFTGYLREIQWLFIRPDLNEIYFSVRGITKEKLKNKKIVDMGYLRREFGQA